MPTLMTALKPEIQSILSADIGPALTPEVMPLFPRFETWGGPMMDEQWVGVRCDHPKYPREGWLDPPTMSILIGYRVGERHQWLMKSRGQDWAVRRMALLMRLLLKRLAREVRGVI